jgi:hypothetical protein
MYDLPLRNAPEAHDRGDPALCAGACLQRRHRRAAGERRALGHGLSQRRLGQPDRNDRGRGPRAVPPARAPPRQRRRGDAAWRPRPADRDEGRRPIRTSSSSCRSSASTPPPPDAMAGSPAQPGRIRIGEDGADLPPKGTIRIPQGKTLVFETPGGGGYGRPEGRSDTDLSRDLATGLSPTPSSYRTRPMIPPRPHIAAMAPYALARMEPPPGKPLISLAQNESLRAPSPAVLAALHDVDHAAYPDPDWTRSAQPSRRSARSRPRDDPLRRGVARPDRLPCTRLCGPRPCRPRARARLPVFPQRRADGRGPFRHRARGSGTPSASMRFSTAVRPIPASCSSPIPAIPPAPAFPPPRYAACARALRADILLVLDEAYGEFSDPL